MPVIKRHDAPDALLEEACGAPASQTAPVLPAFLRPVPTLKCVCTASVSVQINAKKILIRMNLARSGALWALTLDSENERLAGEEGGIEALVAIICKEDASDALLEKVPLPVLSAQHRRDSVNPNFDILNSHSIFWISDLWICTRHSRCPHFGFPPDFLRIRAATVQMQACGALGNLAYDTEHKIRAGKAGGVVAVIAVLKRPEVNAQNPLATKVPTCT